VNNLRAVRLDIDGTLTDVQVPTGDTQTDTLREAVGGWVEFAHWGRRNGTQRLALVLDTDARGKSLPANLYATSLVSAVRRAKLPYTLHGPVVLLGAVDAAGNLTDLPESLHAALPGIVAALKSRYTPAN
jgi:hypothetical protein